MLKDIIFFGVKNIKLNKTRSFLSVLGIIIGVFTIILVNAIGNGVDHLIKQQLKFLNVNNIIVEPTSTNSKLKTKDLDKILEKSKYIKVGIPMIYGRGNVKVGDKSKDYTILGTDENFLKILNFNIKNGIFFTKDDIKYKNKGVVVGKGILDYFFEQDENILGKKISINKKQIKILGILDDVAFFGPFPINESIILPYPIAENLILGDAGMTIFFLQVDSLADSAAAGEEIKTILREVHNLKKDESDDFIVFEQKTIVTAVELITKAISFLLIGVATIILIVSGIGIMNIMYATVAERKKEIGISRAIGATKKDIIIQFLVESISLTIVGGIIGIIFGESLIYIINALSDIKLVRSAFGDIFAFLFGIVIGIIFGIFPAKRASELEIVSALE